MSQHTDLVDIIVSAENPDAPALTCGQETLTYADVDRRSNRVARALAALGVESGSRVAVLDRNSIEHFEVLFACAKLGAAFVPVNWRLAPREVAELLVDAGAQVLFVGEEFAPEAARLRAEGELPTVETVVVAGKSEELPTYAAWRDAQPPDPLERRPERGDVVLQMYTSGTTGLPKGVLLTHANLCDGARVASGWGLDGAAAASLVCMPLFHMSGTSWGMLGLYHGAHLVVLRDADPAAVVAAIKAHRITHAVLVPTLVQMVLAVPGVVPADFGSLRLVVYGGSPISEQLLVAALETLGCPLMQLYGLTESTGLATILPPSEHVVDASTAHRLRSVGRAAPGVELRIVDPDSITDSGAADSGGTDCGPGEVGEVWLRSSQVMLGYWQKPVETAEALVADGWLRSGDAAYTDADGYVFIVDRVKDMIVTGGENVYPAEVELVLSGLPGVSEVAVIGVPDGTWGECVTAVVVLAIDVSLSDEDVIGFARERLAHYKCPRRVEFVDALPRNATGKVLKRSLRDRHWQEHDRQVG
jgi:long-chain acyl-CoA synthetase